MSTCVCIMYVYKKYFTLARNLNIHLLLVQEKPQPAESWAAIGPAESWLAAVPSTAALHNGGLPGIRQLELP